MGLAHTARVEPGACNEAIEVLSSPDPDSRDLGDGRRIERVNGGFRILNYERVLSEGAREARREYMRQKQREHRAKKRANGGTIRPEHVHTPLKKKETPLKTGLSYPPNPEI